MRALLLLIFLIFVTNIEASCLKAVAALNIRSDYPVEISFDSNVAPGESVNNARGRLVFVNETPDILELYRVRGSVHSGYFMDGVVAVKGTCEVVDLFELAGE